MTFLLKGYRQVYLAITDFGFYRTVFEQRFARSLDFLIFLSVHIALAMVLVVAPTMNSVVTDLKDWMKQTILPLEIKDGQLVMTLKEPITKFASEDPSITFVFDRSGAYEIDLPVDTAVVVFQENEFLLRHNGTERRQPWPEGDYTIEAEQLESFHLVLKAVGFPVFFLIVLAMFTAGISASAMIFGSSAWAAAALNEVQLPWPSCITIGLYATAPPIAILVSFMLLGLRIPMDVLVYLTVGSIYAFQASKACVVLD